MLLQIVQLAPSPRFIGNAECRMENAECRMQSAECRVQSAKCRMQNAEFRMQNCEGTLYERRRGTIGGREEKKNIK